MEEMLKLLSQYGTPLVVTAIALFGLTKIMNIYIDKLGRQVFQDAANKEAEQEQRHEKLLDRRVDISQTVNTALERALLRTNADRVFVYEFHNGVVNLNGLPFLKATNTYEIVGTGIPSLKIQHDKESLGIYSDLIGKLMAEEVWIIDPEDKGGGATALFAQLLAKEKVKLRVVARITNVKGKLIGYCGIDFVRRKRTITDERIELVQDLATEIGALLSVDYAALSTKD